MRRASMRWTSEHGNKIVHRNWVAATIHRIRLTFKFKRGFSVYRCQWGQWYRDGETAPTHWHVGGTRNKPKERRAVRWLW